MTATMSTSLHCDRETRPRVDGMRTICGTRFGPYALTVDQVRTLAREIGWMATGIRDLCPEHAQAGRIGA